jgi:hypothetical protein
MTPDSVPPGWYPDPWGLAAYRWWSGSSWEAPVSGSPEPRHRGRTARAVAFVVGAAVLFSWAGLWLVMLPLLVLNDADNGRAGHDFRTLWLPEFLPAVITATVCLVMVQVERRKPLRARLLALPTLLFVATVIVDAVAFASHTS